DLRAEFRQAENVGARDAAEENVAHDDDVEIVDLAALLANGVDIEQSLSWVFVCAVAGIDDARFQSLRQKLWRASGTVAQNENVGMQSFEIARRVLECLAVSQTRRRRGNVDHVRAETKRRYRERRARPRAWFDEKVDQRFATKRGHFLDLSGADLFERIGCFENKIDFVRGKF